jgi:hypothetical protein
MIEDLTNQVAPARPENLFHLREAAFQCRGPGLAFARILPVAITLAGIRA